MWTYIWHLIVFDRRKTSHTKLFWMKMIKYTHSHSRCVCANKRNARASTPMCQNNHMASNRSADLLNERNVSNNLSNYFNAHVCVSNARFILKIDAFSTNFVFKRFLLACALRCMLIDLYVVIVMKLKAEISVTYSSAYFYALCSSCKQNASSLLKFMLFNRMNKQSEWHIKWVWKLMILMSNY